MSGTAKIILMGGPGRSGTTYLAAALGAHPAIASFPGVELKLLFERDGLVDLGWVLCDSFSPNRAWVGLARFRTLMNQLLNGGFDQPLLQGPSVYAGVNRALERFYSAIAPEGIAQRMCHASYRAAARKFFADLVSLARACKPEATHFLEKTPHNLLAPQALADFTNAPWCLHVIRDPRATAASLVSQSWGPNTLPSAAAWVKSYYDQWLDVRSRYASLGLSLTEVRIEDVVADPVGHGERLLAALDLMPMPVFTNADGRQLMAGQSALETGALQLLDDRLGPLAEQLGYGARLETSPPSPAP